MTVINILMVGIGGFFGAISRFTISRAFKYASVYIPVGTLIVNLLGAFLLGIITGVKLSGTAALLLGTGFMGALTTFSTLKLEIIQIRLKKMKKSFYIYIILTYGFGLLLAYLGFLVGKSFL